MFGSPVCEAHDGLPQIPANEGWVTIPATEGVDYYINTGAVTAGTYRLNPDGTNTITATAQESYILSDEFSQNITIGAVPSYADCNEKPAPQVVTEENSSLSCEAGTITTWQTITTTDYTLNETQDNWVLDTDNPVITQTEPTVTQATEEQLTPCPTVVPEDLDDSDVEEPQTPKVDGSVFEATPVGSSPQGSKAVTGAELAKTGFNFTNVYLAVGVTAIGAFLVRIRRLPDGART